MFFGLVREGMMYRRKFMNLMISLDNYLGHSE